VIRDIYRSSYPGFWFDPLNSPGYFHAENTAALVAAFSDQLRWVSSERRVCAEAASP
jgi:hypothetical protein